MENLEMKQKNEEILNKWRNYGLLQGLATGSTNEWRCAKSYDEMANYCIEHESEISTNFSIVIFPIIRRSLCTGKKHLTRIVHPEEIIKALTETTINDAFNIIDKNLPIKGQTGMKSVGRRLLRNFCEKLCISSNYDKLSCLDLINLENEEYIQKVEFFNDITSCDFKAKMCIIYSEVIKEKLNALK